VCNHALILEQSALRGEKTMYHVGDMVVHPDYGAGVVTEVRRRNSLGTGKQYYSIELLAHAETVVMVPVGAEERVGLRAPISRSHLGQLWRVLRADPNTLPSDHNQRYALLKDKLAGGDVFQIAEAIRDLAWRKEEKRHLTARGKRLYERGMMLLASEIAGAQGEDLDAAETQIANRLTASIAASVMA
jgi:CarD family transcriptional regulator